MQRKLSKKGVPEKRAKAICAGMYYNRHGITVKEAHKRGLKGMLYFARTKEALKTLLLANRHELEDFVIVKIPNELRKNEIVKSLYPKVENEEYLYVAVNKSVVDVTLEGKVVLSIEKLVSAIKENETSKQNENNVAHVEAGKEVVKDGKLEKSSGESGSGGKLQEELKMEKLTTKSMSDKESKEENKKDEKDEKKKEDEKEEELPTLHDVMSKVAKGEKLSKVERHILSVALDAVKDETRTTAQEREVAKNDLHSDSELSDATKDVLTREFGTKEEEDKALTATTPSVEALEKEDLEPDVLPVTKSLVRELLVANKSLSLDEPVFDNKHDATRFARMYNLKAEGTRAYVVSASLPEKRKYGNKVKYVVKFE